MLSDEGIVTIIIIRLPSTCRRQVVLLQLEEMSDLADRVEPLCDTSG